jgi:hypothetical protein
VWRGSLPAGERARPVGSSALRIQPQVQLSNFNALGGSYEVRSGRHLREVRMRTGINDGFQMKRLANDIGLS